MQIELVADELASGKDPLALPALLVEVLELVARVQD